MAQSAVICLFHFITFRYPRIDADELKALLRKHSNSFTDADIVEIGELYYASKAGGSVSFDSFIEAIDRAAAATVGGDHNDKFDEKVPREHFKETDRHPLGISNYGVEFLHTAKSHHGHYTEAELHVNLTHVPPQNFRDRLAFDSVKLLRNWFDMFTGWKHDSITVNNILNRVIYLETIAAVPGMVAAIVRHFRSLRTMKTDGGYMQLFLEEANNERYVSIACV
jgi:Alternative oxidase